MNDNELITMVRESVADLHSFTPVAQVISRGRALRARRRIPGVAGALAITAGTALAVATLLPSGQPTVPGRARLAAWTVAKLANGSIDVTINQLQNPAGLQGTLRADGLRVNISFSGHPPIASCQPYLTNQDVVTAVAHASDGNLVIDPSALPSGAGLAIFEALPQTGVPIPYMPFPHGPRGALPRGDIWGYKISEFQVSDGTVHGVISLEFGLVYASQQCTG